MIHILYIVALGCLATLMVVLTGVLISAIVYAVRKVWHDSAH